MRRRVTNISVAAAAFTLLGTMLTPAQAGVQETVADGLISPLSVAVSGDGTVYVSQNFAGRLTRVSPEGQKSRVYTDPDRSEVGAVSVTGEDVTFATTGGTRKKPTANLWQISGAGDPTKLANLFRYEKRNNPDSIRNYGLKAGERSLSKVPRFIRPYSGRVESHPYATALGTGVTYVADAAGNSVLAVTDAGVSTVAVLPVTKVKITRATKREFDLHKCVIGKTYRAEGVPTDVELGPDGNLYVTSLPGVPGEGGPFGRIYQINPDTGDLSKEADGLVSPTGLAISPTGTAYIAQLFAGTILEVPLGGEPSTFAEVPFPGDVEFSDGFVYATKTDLTNDGTSPPAGKVLRWDPTP